MIGPVRMLIACLAATMLLAGTATAQLGSKKVVLLEEAKKIAAAAHAEAVKNKWNMVIAIVDDTGNLIYLERMDNAQVGSVSVAQGKARTAAQFRRPTRVFEEAITKGRNALLNLSADFTPVTGGVPIISDGVVIGAVGVSGGTGDQDEQCAKAGAALVQ